MDVWRTRTELAVQAATIQKSDNKQTITKEQFKNLYSRSKNAYNFVSFYKKIRGYIMFHLNSRNKKHKNSRIEMY